MTESVTQVIFVIEYYCHYSFIYKRFSNDFNLSIPSDK